MTRSGADHGAAGGIVGGVDGSASSEPASLWAVGGGRLTGRPVHAHISCEFPLAAGADASTALDWEGDIAAGVGTAAEKVLGEDGARLVDHQVTAHTPCPVVLVSAPTTSGGRTTVHEAGA